MYINLIISIFAYIITHVLILIVTDYPLQAECDVCKMYIWILFIFYYASTSVNSFIVFHVLNIISFSQYIHSTVSVVSGYVYFNSVSQNLCK